MKKVGYSIVLIVAAIYGLASTCQSTSPNIQVRFSPGGGCTHMYIHALQQAKKSVLVQAYSFTSFPIAQTLIELKQRKIEVVVILDHSNQSDPHSIKSLLEEHHIPVYLDHHHAIAHNKVMVIDDNVVITGSFNFTNAAEHKNAENCLVIKDKELNKQYKNNWEIHRSHSEI